MEEKRQEAEDVLAAMGLSLEDVEEADRQLELQGKRRYRQNDTRVCVCGHGVGRHTVLGGVVYCKPSRMECPCKKCRPILCVEDSRKFLYKTSGAGSMHALSLGILASAREGKSVQWLLELPLTCDRCGSTSENIVPVPVTQTGRATSYPTGYDALLCPKCRVEV